MTSLKDFSRKMRTEMAQADTGPLIVAKRVVDLAENWDAYKDEVGGLNVSAWLTRELGNRGRSLAWFSLRHAAVLYLGEDIRRTLHHEVAVYVMRNVPEAVRRDVKLALTVACRKNNGCPLTMGQALPHIRKIVGKVDRRGKTCVACAAKDEEIRKLKAALAMSAAAE